MMKTAVWLLAGLLLATGCKQDRTQTSSQGPGPRTLSSFDSPARDEKPVAAKMIRFEQAELDQVLALYAEISGRSIIRAPNVPEVKITFSNQAPLTRVEVLQALDTVLAAQNITTVLLGTKYVKVVPSAQAATEAGPIVELQPDQLPDSSSFVIYIVKLKNVTASEAVSAVQPFAKLPNSIVAVKAGGSGPASAKGALPKLGNAILGKDHDLLILRDYSSNVRRMLHVLGELENAK